MKRVIMGAIWNDGHFFPSALENWIEVLDPDIIVLNEGLFPTGQEDHGYDCYSPDYYETYANKKGRSFDLGRVLNSINAVQAKHTNVQISINHLNYKIPKHLQWPNRQLWCAQTAAEYGMPEMDPLDLVFWSECDMYYHEKDKEALNFQLNRLPPGRGFTQVMRRFFRSPFVRITQHDHKPRIQAKGVRWGDGELWKTFFHTVLWGKYDPDKWVHFEHLDVFHYEWVRPSPKYWGNKLAQIPNRKDKFPGYEKAKECIDKYGVIGKEWEIGDGYLHNCPEEDHPKHFRGHPEYQRFYSGRSASPP